jgi:hypothetical protein
MDTWARVRARLALRLDLELVRGVPGLQGTDSLIGGLYEVLV